jgi:hypothetical protein
VVESEREEKERRKVALWQNENFRDSKAPPDLFLSDVSGANERAGYPVF